MTRLATVVLNPKARRGAAPRLYRRVRPELASRFDLVEVEMGRDGGWQQAIARALAGGCRTFIAAGGDGTVNAVASSLIARHDSVPLEELRLGAVGLGSSNDFHKPFRSLQHGVALRLDEASAAPRDVGRAVYEDECGVLCARFFLVSASMGVTAVANARFNGNGPVLRRLKSWSTSAAISWAALAAIARHRTLAAVLTLPEGSVPLVLSNLGVMKTPFLSGGLRYDTPVSASDGRFAVNACEGMGRWRLLRTLRGLSRGRFLGRPGTRHWCTSQLTVQLAHPAELELDGEVVLARRVAFQVLDERLTVCGA